MIVNKNNIIRALLLVIGVALMGAYIWTQPLERNGVVNTPVESPEPSATENPSVSALPGKSPNVAKIPLSTGNDKTTFIDEPVPWHLLLSDASCELKGEIKFLNANTYDNQDAVFIYNGIDHPGRNIKWTITPNDGSLSVGPNIFSKIPIPNGRALLGVFPLQEPKSKRYELTAKIGYGRLVDENGKIVTAGGNVKIFEKQCQGKTVVVFP